MGADKWINGMISVTEEEPKTESAIEEKEQTESLIEDNMQLNEINSVAEVVMQLDEAALAAKHRRRSRWKKIVGVMACIVVFCTTYALILPAITLEKDNTVLACPVSVHQHEAGCYGDDGSLICGQADYVIHTHADNCYDAEGNLVCQLPEIEAHEHDESCYDAEGNLTCDKEEIIAHKHDESCYDADGSLICGKLEVVEHIHGDGCFAALEDAGDIMSLSEDESKTTVVSDGFMLWLYDQDGNKVAGYSKDLVTWQTDDANASVRDVLQITGTNNYLIPVKYFIENYQSYGYSFRRENPGVCPFKYAPNAVTAPVGKTNASYVQVGDEWYVQVQDTGSYMDPSAPRSNIYYEPQSFTLWLWEGSDRDNEIKEYTISGTEVISEDDAFYLIPVSYFIDAYGSYGYSFDKTDTDDCPFVYAPDATDPSVGITSASYVQVGDKWYVRVQDTGLSDSKYTGNPRCNVYYYSVVTTTVNHPGSVINLFDYWIDKQDAADYVSDSAERLSSGINYNHALKFRWADTTDALNQWTKSAEVRPGIVASLLTDGYPTLSGAAGVGLTSENFPGYDLNESLAYLFDPTMPVTVNGESYKESHRNVSGLLQVDSNGYYYYDSQQNYAEYDAGSNSFTLYNTWGVTSGGDSGLEGQFFPFNSMTEAFNAKSTSDMLNHYFGMTLTTRFIQRYGGFTTSKQKTPTIFEFKGDDDVWIFIDGVLVADLGGIHNPASVGIDFSTGKVIINGSETHTLRDAFEDALEDGDSKLDNSQWNGNTFADNTTHTLKFYFLERGNTDSDLHLKYNLAEIPATAINKVDQYGKKVKGAGFAVYKAQKDTWKYCLDGGGYIDLSQQDYKIDSVTGVITIKDGDESKTITPKYVGVTDAGGQMVFVDGDEMPYSLTELQGMFGDYFILRECDIPQGYRLVSDEIYLYIKNDVLLCANTYDSGVWASPTLLVTATDRLHLSDSYNGSKGKEVQYYKINDAGEVTVTGTLFAVVFKYTGSGDSSTDIENWHPVYGSDEAGYNIITDGDTLGAAIKAAGLASKDGSVAFSISASGTMQVELTNLPGDVTTYYRMIEDKTKAQYTVSYYWTSADSVEEATTDNTYRVYTDKDDYGNLTVPSGFTDFDRSFGATINVPNLINRLFVQKLDEDGELINGAGFALYKVVEDENQPGTIYYVAGDDKGTRVLLNAKNNEAVIDGTTGTYTVDTETGVITVTVGEKNYYIEPVDSVQITDANSIAKEEGTCVYDNLPDGTYFLREIAAPAGYEINSSEVMVLVTGDAIYANAGTENDGVNVARGPGYVVSTLDQFASQGQIDNTLTWVYERLLVSPVSNTFNTLQSVLDASGKPAEDWCYLKANYDPELVYSPEDALTTHLKYGAASDNVLFNYTQNSEWYAENGLDVTDVTRRLYTSVGWSYYLLYQDYDWGKERIAAGTNYPQLLNDTGSPLEISNLFSRSTYIQVTDQRDKGNLEISKTVKNAPDGKEDSFDFTVTLTDSSGAALEDKYIYEVYEFTYGEDGREIRTAVVNDDGEKVTGTIVSGGAITLRNGQVAVIKDLPGGTRYTVAETPYARYTTTAVRDDGKPPDGDQWRGKREFTGSAVTGKLYWYIKENGEVDTTSTVDFTNSYLSDLMIWKVETGTSTPLQGAEFVLYKTENGVNRYYKETEDGVEWVSLGEGTSEDDVILTSGSDGKIILDATAFHAEETTTYYLKELKSPDGYYPLADVIHFTITDSLFDKDSVAVQSMAEVEEDCLTLKVSNSSGYELPDTGGSGIQLYIWAGMLLILGSTITLLYKYKKLRGKEDSS